ncbi:MAG: hypothetical protein A2539_01415 [Elusimicrobia bacterium RIFOXYD2_FULL_34_15]|nr:MAG: hypothetical protein A2539_01415 [Elusimicrobia bacterium RIFOXYD2_FULL_34_15]
MIFEEIIVKIAKEFDKKKIPYMIVGGQAVLLYGEPRLTEDIDITLGVDIDFLDEIKKVCKKCGLLMIKGITDDFTKKTNVLPCVEKSNRIKVDFIFSYSDYEKQAMNKARRVKIANTFVKFASPEDVIIHKIVAGRPRDMEDIKNILLKQNRKIDKDYIVKWLDEFSKLENYKNIKSEFQKILKSCLNT